MLHKHATWDTIIFPNAKWHTSKYLNILLILKYILQLFNSESGPDIN